MSKDTDRYLTRLTWELRRRGVSGDAVGDAIAQVESHLADEGGDPRSVFGAPAEYAASIAAAVPRQHRWAAYALHFAFGAVLAAVCAAAIVRLIQGEIRTFGIDSAVVLVVGAVMLAGYGMAVAAAMRRRLRDPRKGMKE